MKLSMSILTWELRAYHPDAHINNDSLSLQGLRFLGIEDTLRVPEYVYVGAMSDYFPNSAGNSYICMNRDSYILLENCRLENVLNTILSAFDTYTNWENRLAALAERHASAGEMMELRSELLRDPYCIQGLDNTVVAISEDAPLNLRTQWEEYQHSGILSNGIGAGIIYDANNNRIRDFSFRTTFIKRLSPESEDMFAAYLRQEHERIAGFVTWYRTKAPEQMQIQINDILSHYLPQAEEFTSDRSQLKSRPTLLADILSGKPIPEEVILAFEKGQGLRWYRTVVLSGCERKDLMRVNFVLSRLRGMSSLCIAFLYEGKIVLLVKEPNLPELLERISAEIPLSDICAGFSAPVFGLSALQVAYRQSVFTLAACGNAQGLHYCKDYAFSFLVGQLAAAPETDMLLHPAVRALEVCDAENGGELSATLREWLHCGCNLTTAAERLHVHRNTMKYRLARIRELTELDFDDPQELLYLQLSMEIRSRQPENRSE